MRTTVAVAPAWFCLVVNTADAKAGQPAPVGRAEHHRPPVATDIFSGLSDQAKAVVMRRFVRREIARGAMVFWEGEPGGSIFVIESGRVRTFHTTTYGYKVTTGLWSRGYVLGLISSVAGDSRVLSAEAIDHVGMLQLPGQDLKPLVAEVPEFGWNLMKMLAFMASSGVARATRLATESVPARLAETLVALAEMPDAYVDGNKAVISGISQEEIANMVSATRPWVTMTLTEFEKQGYLLRERRRITIPDMPALRKLAAGLAERDAPQVFTTRQTAT